jgi:cellulose biosynthesis protein BcsQ
MEEVVQEFKEENHLGKVFCVYSAKGGVGKTGTAQILGEGTQFFMKKDKIKRICVDFNVEEGSFSKKFVQTAGEYKFELLIDAFKENADDKQLRELLKSVIVEKPNFKYSKIEFPCDVLFAPSENKSKNSIEIYKQRDFVPKILSMLKEMYDLVLCDCSNAKTILNYQLFNHVDNILLVINTDKNSIDQNEEFIREVLNSEELRKKVLVIFNEHDKEELDVTDQRIINSMFGIPENTREMKEFVENRLVIFPKIPIYRKISNRRDAVFNPNEKYLTEECRATYIVSLKKLFGKIVPALVYEQENINEEGNGKKGFVDKFFGKFLK